MKEPKTISALTEARLQDLAEKGIEELADLFPGARDIDLLNAYLKVFTEQLKETSDDQT